MYYYASKSGTTSQRKEGGGVMNRQLKKKLHSLVNKLKPGTIKQVGQKDLSFIKVYT